MRLERGRRPLEAVATAGGASLDADVLVLATGQLHRPACPRIEGREAFAGHSFHSAEWDHAYDLRGKRVAVIGTGASAVQFVPEIAEEAERLLVFQRTGNWFLPRRNRAYPAPIKAIIRHVPGVQAFRRRFMFNYGESLTAMIRHPRTFGRLGHARSAVFMRWQLRDPELRRKVWPDYTFGCKRVLFSSHFLPALQRPNVELVTERDRPDDPARIVTADGRVHEVDCVIYGTGFRTNDFMFPMEVTGAGGPLLRDAWADGAHAHLGMTVPGFPSLFVMYGPNTNTSGGSIIVYLEAQAAYLRQALEHVRGRRAAAIDVRPDVEAASDREVQARFAGTAWTRCDSWYRNAEGRLVANWPGYMREYIEGTRRDVRVRGPLPRTRALGGAGPGKAADRPRAGKRRLKEKPGYRVWPSPREGVIFSLAGPGYELARTAGLLGFVAGTPGGTSGSRAGRGRGMRPAQGLRPAQAPLPPGDSGRDLLRGRGGDRAPAGPGQPEDALLARQGGLADPRSRPQGPFHLLLRDPLPGRLLPADELPRQPGDRHRRARRQRADPRGRRGRAGAGGVGPATGRDDGGAHRQADRRPSFCSPARPTWSR